MTLALNVPLRGAGGGTGWGEAPEEAYMMALPKCGEWLEGGSLLVRGTREGSTFQTPDAPRSVGFSLEQETLSKHLGQEGADARKQSTAY